MNTRKYPRTMNEAFQHTADYACSIESPKPLFARDPVASKAVLFSIILACVVLAFVL